MNPLDDKYRALRRLPPFPGITTKLLRVLSQDDAEVPAIVSLIRADAALSSEMLRIVNSPVYGFPNRIGSIHNAVLLLGFETVRKFALAVSMKGFLNAAVRLDVLRKLWRHSLACGIVCDELSAVCSVSQSRDDRAYTAGLLHNIGRLCLFVSNSRAYSTLLYEPGEPDILERERKVFDIDHCDAGAWLARTWGLPQEIQDAVRGHHEPPGGAQFDLVNLVRVGVLLIDVLGFDVQPPTSMRTLDEIRSMLPEAAQFRFDPDPEVMKARITDQLDTYD